ncbi:chitobiase/beta-hexosaminidase C-terminal domain-containing protein [Prevotella communis]|uniref:chitobiase/beta-hexosaminidase C-terminal domain-containing protein n=1 Tax=Prevotella communis TaxID=2913614 RepID=UPI001EDBE0CD|nr:chitobiase/beta-hexosaminidase C-terminal domain-containing protein [Prevotella communis]UKK62019.1 chitobiase/beta-hexosaminidase C-terminal domain-containing protein [Prevotella communis]UKK64846.1 chitobiase/beta-hexosaminidase C-terminal domain-containing protein [Prevotella communis]
MNKIYEKGVTRNQQAYSHTIAILMSMLRVWLEYGWSMARVWLKYASPTTRFLRPFSSKRAELERRLVGHEITTHSWRDYGSLMTRLRLTISMLLMLTLGSGNVWGQTDYSGVYYIGTVTHSTESTTNNFYLCPTEGYYYYQSTSPYYTNVDNGMPFLTTYNCRSTVGYNERKALWVIEKHPSLDCYYIKHAIDGKYLTYNAGFLTNMGRVRFHLEESPSNNDYALFYINYYDNTSSYEIISKYASDNNIDPDSNKPRKYLNINKGNQQSLAGTDADKTQAILTGGIIGLWTAGNSESSGSGKFYLESAVSIDPPTITNNFDGTITIAAATGATIYYTTDGSTPTTESYAGTGTTSVNVNQTESMTVIKAIAKVESDYYPTVATTYNLPNCERPSISVSGGYVTITCTTEGATIHYTTDGTHATSSSTVYTGPFAKGSANEIRAIATKVGYVNSNETALLPPTEVSFSSEITDMNGNYSLASDFSSDVSIGTSENPFSGTIDGNYITFSLSQAFIDVADGAIIKNIIISSANISGSGNAGAIVNTAKGSTRIYNCGVLDGSISGDDNVGGIAGELQGLSRVINCYNYANIESGNNCGGIVGYNRVASTSSNLQTMVMNCMFYGNITGGNAAPIYGGEIIHNKYSNANNTGLNNYCYFLYDEEKVPYVKEIANDKYHGALGAEERYLNRFEFFRMTLNSTRDMAAFYVTGDATQKDEMAKWVLDKSIAPYPILKTQGKYPSVVNPDAAHATAQTDRNKGGLLGTLSVTISGVGGGAQFTAPSGASLTTDNLTLNITDKDYDNFNYNYKKVQLPYYNEVGKGNYTDGRVVTGWKITSITGGTPGSFTTDTYDYPSFNYVDRKCTNKDLYGTGGSNRVFAQGAYWEVPDGVESITIEPYWAKAVYLSDANYDVTYNGTSKYGVTVGGSCPSTYNGQQVYNSVSSAMTALGSNASHSVYDYAVVLVGNYHQYSNDALVKDNKPVTFMSADLDGDDEPDNTLFYYHNQRKRVSPIRFDFLNIPGVGMVKRTYDATMDPEPGIFKPRGWFEITNTVFIRFGQFEYAGGNNGDTKDNMAPLILQGGIYEQFVSCTRANAQNTNYLLIGSNAWFKNFANGCHTAQANTTPKVPINVAGGDYTNFYLTGIYQPNTNENVENAECYIDGGRFTEVAGAGMQQIKGDVTWLINAADITSFFGGGINATKPITGSISTTISNSNVDEFYGGPKFGDMYEEKTVTTNATDCHFGKFFGAGYGGTAFNRVGCEDDSKTDNSRGWDSWVTKYYKRAYDEGNGGISTNYDYEFILHSDGNQTVARFFVNYASLSLASTRNVTNTLSGCTIGTFYGGGSLGAVNGDVNSTLTNCTVTGSAFGAGFSASVPTVEVWNTGAFLTPKPTYNRTANVFNNANVKTPKDNDQFDVYTWSNTYGTNADPFTDEDGKHYIHTDVSLEGLGSVTGKATLTINGTTTVGKSVYGGGEESGVAGDTEVNVTSGTIGSQGQGGVEYGNVYGGGKGKVGDKVAGYVKGNTTVNISQASADKPTTIYHNVYGGGAYGSVGDFTYDGTTGMPTACAENTGSCTVNIQSGTFGWDGKENGMVFGSSRGDVATPEGDPAVDPNDRMAWVYSTHVTIGDAGAATSPTIKGSVYGSGENGHTFQNTIVDINKGIIGITDTGTDGGAAYAYRGNVYGGGCGTDKYDSDGDDIKDAYNPLAGIVKGTTTVNITGGHVVHNVYGAGAMGSVGGGADAASGKTTINISGGRIGYDGDGNGHIFGAARGEYGVSTAASGLANVRETSVNINYTTTPAADNADKNVQLIAGTVFGGGEAGTVKGSVAVNMTGGLILKDVYGGGALADTQTDNWDATANENAGGWADAEKKSALHTTTVRLTGGRIGEDVFGGGLGEAGKPAYVWGDVLIDLNGTTSSGDTGSPIDADAKGCVVGQVFGCNNINGTPKGTVTVHVYATQSPDKDNISTKPAKGTETFDVEAVYGGGSLAAYEPEGGKNTNKSTKVIIDGCGLTSIRQVYGGGNAASTPATNVEVNGTYEILELFGGGNGLDNLPDGRPNPGANVGYKNYTIYEKDGEDKWIAKDDPAYDTKEERTAEASAIVYGTGQASVNVFGGTIHRVFGGSNTKGNVRKSAVTLLDENSGCDFCVDEAYGGGKSAPMDAEAKLLMACIPGLKAAYGGARAADIQGDVVLNITNGTFDRIFGGNNESGTIRGSIVVNIEETGCRPLIIGELYGGGNLAGYSKYGYKKVDDVWLPREAKDGQEPGTVLAADPQVNVRSFTSIGSIYGGGYGETAVMVGNPHVNINVTEGKYAANGYEGTEKTIDGHQVIIPPHVQGKIGAIQNVYGGGYGAKVDGDTYVNIGTQVGESIVFNTPFTKTVNNIEVITTSEDRTHEVKGVDIRGSIYGGGYGSTAVVTGNTNVQIGK